MGEKGSLIASECKRFGVRWDTGRQAGGWLKLLWIAGGEWCDTLRDGTGRPRAGPGPPSTYIRNAHNRSVRSLVRSSVGSPLACTCTHTYTHTKRERETRQTRRERAAHSRILTRTMSQAGERRQAGRQAGGQASRQAGRQAGRRAGGQASRRAGTLLRQRHCLPSARFGLARAAALVRLCHLRRPLRSVLVVLD